jgi:hypothetical protein
MTRAWQATLALLCGVLLQGSLSAQDVCFQRFKNSNVGTEFWFSFPPCYEEVFGGAQNNVVVYIASWARGKVRIEVPGKGFFREVYTIPNDVLEVVLSPAIGQPYTKSPTGDAPSEDQVWRGAGVHIVSDVPIAVYGVTRFVYTTDAFMVIPKEMLGTEYVVASYPDMSAMYPGYYLPSETVIVATEDNTEVIFTLGGNQYTRTRGGMRPGQTKRWTLFKGDVIAISSYGPEADLSGSRILATKPVAVVSGNQCANVPTSMRWCDFIAEMEIPVYAWGKTYFVTPIFGANRMRNQNSVIRIFAKEPNTKVYMDGQEYAVIPKGFGGLRNEAWLDIEDPDPSGPRPIVISADKPIYVVQYNKGQETDPPQPTDPFQMALPSLEQAQTHVIFCTPGARGGIYSFPRNFINFVFPLNPDGTLPVDLEFGEMVGGQLVWTPIRSKFGPNITGVFAGQYQGRRWGFKLLVLPGNGVYQIRSRSGQNPFMAYSYGGSDYDSYGFVTTMAFGKMLPPQDTIPPLVTWTLGCNGAAEGLAVERPAESSIRSNFANVYLDPDVSFNYSLTLLDQIIPGTTSAVRWRLDVIDPTQPARARVVFIDRKGNDTCITAEYLPFRAEMNPGRLDYGLLKVGQSRQMTLTISNPLTYAITLTEIRLKQGNQGFAFTVPPTVPLVLQPGEQREYTVRFTATQQGTFVDSVGFGNECEFRYWTELRAQVGEPVISATDYDYGAAVPVGTEVPGWIQVRNEGSVDLVITGYTGPSDPATFRLVNWPTISPATPLVVRPGASVTLQVNFAPSAPQAYSDAIVFHSDATRVDSVSLLQGRAVRAEISAQGYDWGRRRIGRGPYDDGGRSGVLVRNVGTQTLTVTNAVPSGPTTGFLYNPGDFVGLTLGPGEQRLVPVRFDPQQTGYYQVRLTLENTTGVPVTVTLSGVGIVPRVRMTPQVDFGTTLVNAPTPNRGTVTIECLEWEFQDALTIADILAQPPGSVSENLAAFGTLGFRYDKAALGLPRVLQPGEQLTFDAEFVAQAAGPVQATLRLQSDAENNDEAVCVWLGNGITQGLQVNGASTVVCAGTTGELVATVQNTGTAPITVQEIRLENATPGATFALAPTAPQTPFDLQPGERRDIPVTFSVPQAGNYSVEVVVRNSSSDRPELRAQLSVEARSFQRTFQISGGPWARVAGDQFWVPIELQPGQDLTLANITQLRVRIRFDGTVIGPDVASLRLGPAAAGMQVVNPVLRSGELEFTLQAQPGQRFTGQPGELARVLFTAYLGLNTQSRIDLLVEAPGNECVRFDALGSGFQLLPVCVMELRRVRLSAQGYSLSEVHPQPLPRAMGAEIEFSIGMTGQTELAVYNTMGERVLTLVSGVMEPGVYRVGLPVEQLAPGVYFYRLQSGPYAEIRRFVVAQ